MINQDGNDKLQKYRQLSGLMNAMNSGSNSSAMGGVGASAMGGSGNNDYAMLAGLLASGLLNGNNGIDKGKASGLGLLGGLI